MRASSRVGFGLRTCHYASFLEHGMPLPFTEVVSENFMGRGGRPRAVLERVRKDAELALHGVSMSLGGVDALNRAYLRELRALRAEIEAVWVSDHLCFGSAFGHYAHDLWPLPYTDEAVLHVAERVRCVQDVLGQRILLENVSSYVEYTSSSMTEWEFIAELCRAADCELLLDVNNVVVSAANHGFDPRAFIDGLPLGRVRQLHLAGHADRGTHRIDDHGGPVGAETLALYRYVVDKLGPVPVIVEWDERVPPLELLVAEAERARAVQEEVLREHDPGRA